ncbi:MAG: hypothetical protein JRJ26_19065 [Deltaproteobacteria bacterium]|nr:hypothetical protein [Deltaproteobacteria bacterium]
MKVKLVAIVIMLVIAGIWAGFHFSQSEEKRVRKQFALLAGWVSKDPGEKPLTTARKIRGARALFAEKCEVKAPIDSLSGTYTLQEISSYAARARQQFSRLSLRFYDLSIEFTDRERATAFVTANLTGRSTGGEGLDETRELQCMLAKIGDKWLFTSLQVVEVLKK